MKKLIVIIGILISFQGFAQIADIVDGESGLSVATKINTAFAFINDSILTFSDSTSVFVTPTQLNAIDARVYPNAGIVVSTGTDWGASITDNSSDWNTAYGWGDHSAAGYLTSYSESDPDFNVHTTSDIVDGTGFLKNNGAGSWSYDNSTYLTGNETITLSGDVTGIGATTITTSLATGSVSDNEIDYTAVTLNDFTFDIGGVSKTEFGYLNGTTSAIQTQLDAKLETEVDGSVSNEGSLTVKSGTSATSIISSNTSGSTDVTLTAGSNITLSESGNNITIAASGGAGPTFVYGETPTGTINGINDAFTTANTPTSETVRVYLNGLRQTPTTDYSVSTNTITFTTAPLTGDVIIVDYNY